MSEHQSKARAELAAALDGQRTELRLKWTDVATRAGFSIATIHRARTTDGELTKEVKIGLEDALRLRRGSIDAKLAGGQLTPLTGNSKSAEPNAPLVVRMSTDDLTELIMTVQESSGRAVADQLLADVKRKRAEWAKRADHVPDDQTQAG